MRAWWLLGAAVAATACSSSSTPTGPGPGAAPPTPLNLVGTTLDHAVALTWDDNAFLANPSNFQNYRVYSTSYSWSTDYLAGQCGSSWQLEGTTVAPEFIVGALVDGVSRCFAVAAVGVNQAESARSAAKALRNLMEMGLSIRPRTHINSQGRVHTSPHTHGKGLSRRITSMASASRPTGSTKPASSSPPGFAVAGAFSGFTKATSSPSFSPSTVIWPLGSITVSFGP